MTAPQPAPAPISGTVTAWASGFLGWIIAGMGFRIGWDVIGFILSALAGNVGKG